MQVKFTNTTGSPVYVSHLYATIAANSSITTRRTAAQLDADQGLKSLVAAGTITLSFASETGDTAPVSSVCKVIHFTSPATATATAVTANFGGDVAKVDPIDVGATITQPDMGRNVTATFGATWGASNHVIVYGTDMFGNSISEQLNSNPGGSRTGAKAFKTVTKVTKLQTTAVDVANVCSIGTGVKLGVSEVLLDSSATSGHLIGTGFDSPTLDLTNYTVSFATAPNGARSWNLFVDVAISP